LLRESTRDPSQRIVRTSDRGQRTVRRLVLAAARTAPDEAELQELLRGVDADELCAFAEHHRVVTLLHRRLSGVPGVPDEARDRLATGALAAQAKRLHAQRTLGVLRAWLDVPFLVMKGQVLAAHWYDDPAMREFNDVDVLVEPRNFERAIVELTAAGFRPLATNWHGFLDHEVGEIPLAFESSVVDLHWSVVAVGTSRRELRLPTKELLGRSESIELNGDQVRTFDSADTLLHLCVNTGLDGARRLRGLVDVDTVVRSGGVDLSVFLERADEAGAARLCSGVLQRARTMLHTPVPSAFLSQLSPTRSWLRVNDLADRRRMASRDPRGGIASGLLLASGRRSGAGTLKAYVRAVAREIATRCGMTGLSGAGGELDWRRVPADGDVDAHRRRYLAWVADAAG
jgi:hypothetical protein